MSMGERLREERERLNLNQPKFAAIAGTTKQTLFSWEIGKTAPDGFQIAALATGGVDVLYVLTGTRTPVIPSFDTAEQVLLENYRRCSPEGQANLLQTAVLLAAGVASAVKKAPRNAANVDMAGMEMHSSGAGAVQVGYAGGKVLIKKGG